MGAPISQNLLDSSPSNAYLNYIKGGNVMMGELSVGEMT